jgi:hypothetical protein
MSSVVVTASVVVMSSVVVTASVFVIASVVVNDNYRCCDNNR